MWDRDRTDLDLDQRLLVRAACFNSAETGDYRVTTTETGARVGLRGPVRRHQSQATVR
jgi:hypothetical protein